MSRSARAGSVPSAQPVPDPASTRIEKLALVVAPAARTPRVLATAISSSRVSQAPAAADPAGSRRSTPATSPPWSPGRRRRWPRRGGPPPGRRRRAGHARVAGVGRHRPATSAARAAVARTAAGSAAWTVAVPTRLPSTTTRTRTHRSSRQADWWMRLEAKRVRPPACRYTSASTSSAPPAPRAPRSLRRSRHLQQPLRPERRHRPTPPTWTFRTGPGRPRGRPGRSGRAGPCRSSAPPHDPLPGPADGVQRPPELGRAPVVGGVAVQPAQAAAPDLPGRLDPELEVDPPVVDRPGPVDAQQHAVVGVGDQLVQGALAGLQVDVGHADQGHGAPAVGPHGPARAVAPGGRLPAGQEAGDHASATSGDRGRGRPRRRRRRCPARPGWSRRR